jgi:hypothetical protein
VHRGRTYVVPRNVGRGAAVVSRSLEQVGAGCSRHTISVLVCQLQASPCFTLQHILACFHMKTGPISWSLRRSYHRHRHSARGSVYRRTEIIPLTGDKVHHEGGLRNTPFRHFHLDREDTGRIATRYIRFKKLKRRGITNLSSQASAALLSQYSEKCEERRTRSERDGDRDAETQRRRQRQELEE